MAQQFADEQQYQEYYQQFFGNPYFQTPEPHKDIGPHPGITYEDFNHYDINQQRDFLKFLREIAFYYHRSLPSYQKSMEEFLNKNLAYNMSQEEHQLMDQYLYVIKEQKEYEARLKLLELETEQVKPEQKEVQEVKVEPKVEPKVEEPIVEQKQEVPKADGQTAPKKKLRLAKPFEAPKPPQAPEYPKSPAFLDSQKFQGLYFHYLHWFQPQTEEEYYKFPTPQEQKAKQDKEEEKKKRKQDEIKRAEEKRKQAIENAKKPKQTEVNEKKVDIDNLEIDLSVFIDPDETRQPVNLVFIGHVDAGKSTLCGRILLELGEVSETDIKKFEQEANQNNRESWWLAYVMDQNEDERAKGKTVECGKAQFLTKTKRFSLADAPGHKSYVQNMIMGACQADVAGLIISAKQGEFESGFEKGGQTQEHALLAKSLGVSLLVVIVTKMDLIDWNQNRFKLITDQVVDFAQKQCNFQNIQIIPTDALSGNNISKPPDAAKCKWYTGPCLLDLLDNIPLPKLNDEGPIRIPILDKFKDLGSTYIYGKLESGKILDGLDVTIYPKKLSFQIAGIYNHKDQRLKYAKAGENIKIKVKNIDDEEIKRGQMVCNLQSNPCQITNEFQAKLKLIELPENQRIISTGYQCIMHLHSIVEEIDLIVEASWDPESKTYIKQNFLKSMSEGIVRITTKTPICLEKCDVIPQLGRFALRGEGRSLGFGEVTKIKPFKAN